MVDKRLLLFDLQDMFISLYELHDLCMDRDIFVAHQFALLIRQLSVRLFMDFSKIL